MTDAEKVEMLVKCLKEIIHPGFCSNIFNSSFAPRNIQHRSYLPVSLDIINYPDK
jgi:hypothetical protein